MILLYPIYTYSRFESAIKETAQKYGTYCRRIAFNILGNNEDAEECVNDAYFESMGENSAGTTGCFFRHFSGK